MGALAKKRVNDGTVLLIQQSQHLTIWRLVSTKWSNTRQKSTNKRWKFPNVILWTLGVEGLNSVQIEILITTRSEVYNSDCPVVASVLRDRFQISILININQV